jgi:putative DNA primase/helicase
VTTAATSDILTALRTFCPDGAATELRAFDVTGRPVRAVFASTDLDAAARRAEQWGRDGRNVYLTINPLAVALAEIQAAAKDEDVTEIRWLPLDTDPVRPADTAATDSERQAAQDVMDGVLCDLEAAGVRVATLTESGNGFQAFAPICQPNNPEGRALVKRTLDALARLHGTATAHVDTKVGNPSRIMRLPGTMNRKGPNTPERPHRLARIIQSGPWDADTAAKNTEALRRWLPTVEPQQPEPRPEPPRVYRQAEGDAQTRYAARALENESAAVRAAANGERNDRLNRAAYSIGQLVGAGRLDRDQAESELLDAALAVGLPEYEARRTIRSGFEAGVKEPRDVSHVGNVRDPGPSANGTGHAADRSAPESHLTDAGNAQRLARLHGRDIRYCHLFEKWYTFDGARWRLDDTGAVVAMGKSVAVEMLAEANRQMEELASVGDLSPEDRAKMLDRANKLARWALKTESAARLHSMVDLARSEPGIPIQPADLDRHPWLLNCVNGTLDLQTGRLREHRREDYLTRLCPTRYDPAARAPTWDRFVAAVLNKDTALVGFLQRLLGYCLTGSVQEQILAIFHGVGANGKSTLLSTVQDVLGPDFSVKVEPELLLAARGERHPTELATLFGRRLVVCSETGESARLNEARVKDLTGGEKISARRMREDFWEFLPTYKLVMGTNHRPLVRGTDHGIWRRLRLVPFEVIFWDPDKGEQGPEELCQDKQLKDKLVAEREGILAWAVRGCLDWQRHGLSVPKSVCDATVQYRDGQDVLGQFLGECCQLNGDCRAKASDLYDRFKHWSDAMGEYVVSQRRFGEMLSSRGYERSVSNGTWYKGLRLKDETE